MKPSRFFWILPAVLALLWGVASFFSCHNDLSCMAWVSHFIPDDWNVYEAVARVKEDLLSHSPYPPMIYWLMGLWMALGRALFGWFQYPDWNLYMQLHDGEHALPLAPAECFFLRLLYVPFFLGLAYFAARLSPSGRPFPQVSRLLWVQPVLIFITLFMGQFDVIPVFFCVLAVYAFSRGPSTLPVVLGFLSLAAGTLTKNFPAVLVPPYLALFLMRKEWRRGAVYGCLAYAGVVLLALHAVWGPALLKSYLRFREMDLDYLLGRTSTAGKFREYFLLLGAVGFLLVWRAAGSTSLRSLALRVSSAVQDPLRFRFLLLMLPLPVMGLILFDRLWHPQYVVWIVPWVVLFSTLGPALYPEGHPAGTMARRLPAFLSLAFFPAVFARFPRWVDSDLLLNKSAGATLGQFLRSHEVLFTFIASCVLLWILLASLFAFARVLGEKKLPATASDPAPPPASEAWVNLAGFFLLIVLALCVSMIPAT